MLSVRFPELEQTLAEAGSATEAAEAHGALCGALCAEAPYGVDSWLDELIEDRSAYSTQCREVLEQVFAETCEALGGESLEFAPLLPDDDEPLAGRADALAHWCQGFLYGLGAGRVVSLEALPDEVGEIIHDMTEISRASVEPREATETDEQAYAELVEFIRVGVQLVYEELEPLREAQPAPTALLH
jgi:uncharacterized protein YgfB (UPF0149 family)